MHGLFHWTKENEKREINIFGIQINTLYTFSSPSGDDNSAFSSCSGVGSASPEMSFPNTWWRQGCEKKLMAGITTVKARGLMSWFCRLYNITLLFLLYTTTFQNYECQTKHRSLGLWEEKMGHIYSQQSLISSTKYFVTLLILLLK